MTRHDDRSPDMPSSAQIDAAIEQVLQDTAVGEDVAPLASFVDDLRVMADGPPALPSPELAALLAGNAGGNAASATAASLPPRKRRRLQERSTQSRSDRSRASKIRLRVAAAGLAGKAAASLALAATVAAGGAAGIFPEPVTSFVRRAIEVITPFELPDPATEHPGRTAHAHANAGVPPADEKPETLLPRPSPQPAAAARQADAVDVRSPGPEGTPDADPPPVTNPTADTSSWVRTHPKKAASPAQGPKAANPPSTPPGSEDRANGRPPHDGPTTQPKAGPQRDHVPPGRPPSGAPHADNPHGGGPQPWDRGPAEDRSTPSEPNGPRSGPGSSVGPPPGHGGQRFGGEPPPSIGPGRGSRHGPPAVPASPCGRSPRSGPDGAPCGDDGTRPSGRVTHESPEAGT